jgi:hypothetical protein
MQKEKDWSKLKDIQFDNVLFVPGLKRNLISYGQAEQDGYWYDTIKESIHIRHSSHGEVLAQKRKNLYIISCKNEHLNAVKTTKGSLEEWHCRLGHPGESTLRGMLRTLFKNVLAWMERASGRKLKALRTDGGGEYTSAAFKCYLLDKGIDHIITAPGTPQDNGGAERKNRTILETVRAISMQSGLNENLWTFATKAAVYLRNRTGFPKTPYEQLIGTKPNVSNLKPFGCKAWIHIQKEK